MILYNNKLFLNEIPENSSGLNIDKSKQLVATISRNIESLGFIFSKKLIDTLFYLSEKELKDLYNFLIPELKKLVGVHVEHKPFYPGFPQQVIQMDELELYINAIIHYITKCRPKDTEKYPKSMRLEVDKLQVIDFGGTVEDLIEILFSMNLEWGLKEKDLIKFLDKSFIFKVNKKRDYAIPNKENLSSLASINLDYIKLDIKTPTDVLRVITGISDGDVTLATNTKFKSLRRSERRFFLKLLDSMDLSEMAKRREKFLRLGEILHPGDYKFRYKKVYTSFKLLREDKLKSWESTIEQGFERGNVIVLEELVKRPGVFIRSLRRCIITFGDKVTANFLSGITHFISLKVLLQARSAIKNNTSPRVAFPKGNTQKFKILDAPLSKEISTKETLKELENLILKNLKTKDSLGKVYIDPILKNYTIPFANRNINPGLHSLTRGTRFEFSLNKNFRFFVHWKNMKRQRVDIDLSALLLDKNYNYVGQISWNGFLRGKGAVHSGDIINAPHGATEFIDMDISVLLEEGIRYILPNVLSFSHQPFEDIPECFFGWMLREDLNSGEHFEAASVDNKINLINGTRNNVPCIIDIHQGIVTWIDMGMQSSQIIEQTKDTNVRLVQIMANNNLPNLYDLFRFHVEARGELVDSLDEADIIFNDDEEHSEVSPFDIATIASNWL